jgi:hypothetical protein
MPTLPSERTMSDEQIDPAVETASEFRRTLRRLVVTAAANGVDVRGSWPAFDGAETGWDVEITSMAPRTTVDVGADVEAAVSAIREAVAIREGVPVADLPPVAEATDLAAVEAVPEGDGDGPETFDYCGYTITVRPGGIVDLTD